MLRSSSVLLYSRPIRNYINFNYITVRKYSQMGADCVRSATEDRFCCDLLEPADPSGLRYRSLMEHDQIFGGDTMKERIKLLFVRPLNPPFIARDLEILSNNFDVRVVDFPPLSVKRVRNSFNTVSSIIGGTLWADVTFSWFASDHAYWTVRLSKMLGRKSVVVVGGYEVAKEPGIGYGSLLDPKSRETVKEVIMNADKILAVSEYNRSAILDVVDTCNPLLIYNAVDYEEFKPGGAKEDLVVTVTAINKETVVRKGLETYLEAARILPDVQFALIGEDRDNSIERLKPKIPENVEITGYISEKEKIRYYQRAKVYCQLSYYESFGVAVVEGMLCECVPVVTDRGALPEVVKDTGFIVPYGDPGKTADVICEALVSEMGAAARERAKMEFPHKRREIELKNVILDLFKH